VELAIVVLAHITVLAVQRRPMQEAEFRAQDVVVTVVTHLVFLVGVIRFQCILKAPGLVDDLAVVVGIRHRRRTSEQVYTTIYQ
jgi:hypothetical protein